MTELEKKKEIGNHTCPKTDNRELLERFAEFCHEHYLGCSQNNGSKSGFEYAYEAEVVFMVNEYLQSMKEKE